MSVARRFRYAARCCLLAFNRHLLCGEDAAELLTEAGCLLVDGAALEAPEVLS